MTKLDFITLDTHSLLSIAIADTSKYDIDYVVVSPTIRITPPTFEPVSLAFVAKSIQIYDSTNLGISCEWCDKLTLPDGIWKVKYTNYPATDYSIEKSFIRVDRLQSKLDELFLRLDFMECSNSIKKSDLELIDRIQLYIDGAIASANNCDCTQAMNLYKQATELIKNFKSCVNH